MPCTQGQLSAVAPHLLCKPAGHQQFLFTLIHTKIVTMLRRWCWPTKVVIVVLMQFLGPKCLADCFKLFDAIHQLTTRHDVITRITQEVRQLAFDNQAIQCMCSKPWTEVDGGRAHWVQLQVAILGSRLSGREGGAGVSAVP
jgi:predicted aldo/keto reductase-like oxidoreductase